MLVRNNLQTANTAYLNQSQTVKEKESISSGQKLQEAEKAAELTISEKLKQKIGEGGNTKEIAEENILSAQSDVLDVIKADEMIQQANRNILNQADDAIKVQSGQTAAVAIELLK